MFFELQLNRRYNFAQIELFFLLEIMISVKLTDNRTPQNLVCFGQNFRVRSMNGLTFYL